MVQRSKITCLFLDVGGVLLSNGWGHEFRKLAADHFQLNYTDMDYRHHLNMVTYEEGKLTFIEYLDRVVFYEKRSFTNDQFRDFIFGLTTPKSDMIELIQQLKMKYKLKIATVNNEGRELNEYRIQKFQLNQFVDFFISSCYVHFRKPDADIFRLALEVAQVPKEQVLYIEDLKMFTEVAEGLGIQSIQHENYTSTSKKLASLGLSLE